MDPPIKKAMTLQNLVCKVPTWIEQRVTTLTKILSSYSTSASASGPTLPPIRIETGEIEPPTTLQFERRLLLLQYYYYYSITIQITVRHRVLRKQQQRTRNAYSCDAAPDSVQYWNYEEKMTIEPRRSVDHRFVHLFHRDHHHHRHHYQRDQLRLISLWHRSNTTSSSSNNNNINIKWSTVCIKYINTK